MTREHPGHDDTLAWLTVEQLGVGLEERLSAARDPAAIHRAMTETVVCARRTIHGCCGPEGRAVTRLLRDFERALEALGDRCAPR